MPMFEPFPLPDVELRDVDLLQKRESDRAYMLRLTSDNLLRPYRQEAGLWSEPGKPEGIHWGWESPTSQLRGHFLGHWLSAAAMNAPRQAIAISGVRPKPSSMASLSASRRTAASGSARSPRDTSIALPPESRFEPRTTRSTIPSC